MIQEYIDLFEKPNTAYTLFNSLNLRSNSFFLLSPRLKRYVTDFVNPTSDFIVLLVVLLANLDISKLNLNQCDCGLKFQNVSQLGFK